MPGAPRFHMTVILMTVGIAAIVLIDQLSKVAVMNGMGLGQTIPVIDGFFHFTYIQNTGAAFGIMSQNTGLLIVVTVILMAAAVIFAAVKKDELGKFIIISIAMIIGGGLGNMIDRIFRGYVVDFLDFKVWNPVFNVADIFVCIGCGLVIIYILFVDGRENGKSDKANNGK